MWTPLCILNEETAAILEANRCYFKNVIALFTSMDFRLSDGNNRVAEQGFQTRFFHYVDTNIPLTILPFVSNGNLKTKGFSGAWHREWSQG